MEHVSCGKPYDQSQIHLESQAPTEKSNSLQTSTNLEKTKAELAAKPTTSKPSTAEITKTIAGYSLVGIGAAATVAIFPIAISIGPLCAGIGFAIGKGIEKLSKNAPEDAGTTGAVIGGSIGTFLAGALIVGGGLLLKDAYSMKQDRKEAANIKPEIKTLEEARAKGLDTMGYIEVLNDVRETFKKGEKYERSENSSTNDPVFNKFNDELNNEIDKQNEILELKKEITGLVDLIPPKTLGQQTGVNRQDLQDSKNQLKLENANTQLRTKSKELEELKNNTDAACLKLLLEDAKPISINNAFNEAPDPFGAKATLADRRAALSEGKEGSGEIFGRNHDARVDAGVKYDGVFEAFNKEIALSAEILKLKNDYHEAESLSEEITNPNLKEFMALEQEKSSLLIKEKSAELEKLVENTNRAYLEALTENDIDINPSVNEARVPLPPTASASYKVKYAAINLLEDYASGDAQKSAAAMQKIKGLSYQNRSTLLSLFDGKFIPENKLTKLERELQGQNSIMSNMSNSIQNTMDTRISSLDVLEHMDQAMNASAFSTLDATYETDGRGINDVAYSNASLGFAYVIDGADHGDPNMTKALNEVLDPFTKSYELALKDKTFASTEECEKFLRDQINQLSKAFRASTTPIITDPNSNSFKNNTNSFSTSPGLLPVGSFVQRVKIGDEIKLVHISMGDTMLVIKKADGDIIFGKGKKIDLGSKAPKAEILSIAKGDQIMLMTDGYSEYFKPDEFKEIIKNNNNHLLLKDEIKADIILRGQKATPEERNVGRLDQLDSANGSFLRYHDPADSKVCDDMGLSWLKVT